MAPRRALARDYGPLRRSYLLLAAVAVASAGFEAVGLVAIVPLLGSLVDGSDGVGGDIGFLRVDASVGALALATAAATLLAALGQILMAGQRGRITARWQHDARLRLLAAHAGAPHEVQQALPDGRVLALATTNIGEGANGARQLGFAVRGLAGVGVFVAGALVIDPLGALLVVTVGAVLMAAVTPLVRASRRAAARLSTINLAVAEDLAEQIGMAADLRIHGVADRAADRFRLLARRHRRAKVRALLLAGIGPVAYRTAGMLLLVGGVVVAAGLDDVPLARIGAVALLLYRSLSYGQLLQSAWQELSQITPYLDDLHDAVEALEDAAVPVGTADIDRIEVVRLDGVGYTHPGAVRPTLRDVDLEIRRGEVVALVGPSGAGKTTLADLVLGLRRPDVGRVTADGVDVTDLSPSTRARLVARVAQDVRVWPATLGDNVRLHRDGIDDATVEAVLRDVGLGDLVDEHGLGLALGNAGRHLSGGQRQRLGVARAVAGDPDVLVLDEPTSALDAANEDLVAEVIAARRGRSAVIVVAHRPATIAVADRVVRVEAGRVVADEPAGVRPAPLAG